MKKNGKKKGFTLIELIVVIAILGILAAIMIPRFSGMRENANQSAVITNLRNIQNAAEMVSVQTNKPITDASITQNAITTVLGGTWPAGPANAVYEWGGTPSGGAAAVPGEATLKTKPDVYPTTSPVVKFSDIK